EGKVINAQPGDIRLGSVWDGPQIAQQRWRLHLHSQPGSQTLTHLGRGCEPNGFELLQQAIAHPCPRLDQLGKTFSKHLAGTGSTATHKLAHSEPKHHLAAPAWHIVNRALILTVDRV